MTETLEVIKQNPAGQETWRYSSTLLQRTPTRILLEAFFNREDLPFHGMLLGKGDRFIEVYFNDRWYNIFEIHAREDDGLRGWYANITLPAVFEDSQVSYRDLALDLLVFPDGTQLVLDEDEFAVLNLPAEIHARALTALAELQGLFANLSDVQALLKAQPVLNK
jgi:uncharacterized protein